MMKRSVLLLLSICLIGTAKSQVGINTDTPHPSAALEVSSDKGGILIPRMTFKERVSIVSPAPGLLVYDTDSKSIYQNAGTAQSPSWLALSGADAQSGSFYMLSIPIDASEASVTSSTINLYRYYVKQFYTPLIGNEGAPQSIPYFPAERDLYYYITYYDDTVIKINYLSDTGGLIYTILRDADISTFMNVVFVVK